MRIRSLCIGHPGNLSACPYEISSRYLFESVFGLPLPFGVSADGELRHWNMGVGYYPVRLYDENDEFREYYARERQNGVSFSGAFLITDRVAVRGSYWGLSDVDDWEKLGFFGGVMAIRGGKWYVGGGYFNEEW